MQRDIHHEIDRLAPHWHRIVRRPLDQDEIHRIEVRVGQPMPFGLEALLKRIGLFQDLWPFLFETPDDFAQATELLKSLTHDGSPDLFPFAGDGNGNITCVEIGDPSESLYLIDGEAGCIRPLGVSFLDRLHAVIEQTLRDIHQRPGNDRKHWHVQFTFNTEDVHPILRVFRLGGELDAGNHQWREQEISAGGVRRDVLDLRYNGEPLQLHKLTHGYWDAPLYSVDMREPALTAMGNSKIHTLSNLFEEAGMDARLISFGAQVEDPV